jgi:hypothetical protein
MASNATNVTITGTAEYPNGGICPGAVIVFVLERSALNNASPVLGSEAYASSTDGTFSITVPATDDAGTSPGGLRYMVSVIEPVQGEHIANFRAPVPHAATATTFTTIQALAN